MNKEQITDIFLDLDHTLWDFDKNSGLAFERVFKTFSIPLKLADFLEVYEPINLQYWRLYREEQIDKQGLRRGRLNDAFAKFELSYPLETIDAMAVQYIEELPKDNYLFDGTEDLLEYLKDKYKLHLITNGFHGVQHKKLQNSGIAHFFSTVTTSEDVGVKKPNPKVFYHALELAGVTAEHAVMIGDSFEADILGAEAVGLHTVFFNYRKQQVDPQRIVVDDLPSIKNYL